MVKSLLKLIKQFIVLLVLISFFTCSNNDEPVKPTVSELLVGKWQLIGNQYVGCDEFDTGVFITNFEFDETPTETTIIEITLEEIEFEHWELGIVTSEITINLISGYAYVAGLYQWVEYESVFENFDTQDLHEKEYIALLTKDRLIWATGCGFPLGIKREFMRVQ